MLARTDDLIEEVMSHPWYVDGNDVCVDIHSGRFDVDRYIVCQPTAGSRRVAEHISALHNHDPAGRVSAVSD